MRYKLLSLFIAAVSFFSSAKTVHWIIASDVNDPVIGSLNSNGRDVLIKHFIEPIAIVADSLGYDSFIYQSDSSNFTPRDVVSTIININSDDEDIFVLYYMGHGQALSYENESEFPLLVMNTEESGQISLDIINKNLAKKSHKAIISIAVASNRESLNTANFHDFSDSISVNKGIIPQILKNIRGCYLTDAEFRSIENGINQLKGELYVASAKRGDVSFGGCTPLGSMDCYTWAFVSCFEEQILDSNFSWLQVFCEAAGIIEEVTEGLQTPYLQLTISKSN